MAHREGLIGRRAGPNRRRMLISDRSGGIPCTTATSVRAAACTLGAATGWLVAGVIAYAAILATGPLAEAPDGIGSLVLVWLAGFVAQVLIGALTYLLPIVLGTGPKERAELRAVLERGWPVRLATLNTGVALLALPLPGLVGAAGVPLVAASGVTFLVSTVWVLVRGVGRVGEGGSSRRPVLLGSAAGAVLTVLAVMVANSGGGTDSSTVAAGAGSGVATVTRTVDVTLADMRIQPGRIEVPKGTGLKLKVTNEDAQHHDLKVECGPATPAPLPGPDSHPRRRTGHQESHRLVHPARTPGRRDDPRHRRGDQFRRDHRRPRRADVHGRQQRRPGSRSRLLPRLEGP
ncbi:hypothetical protein ACIRVK_33125 [Streptomyces sp. NPDC101152]|uniref:hypothetical protein n=1 Tax=Streptomyces sp. NPDC101152 TaxID=3366116 RepID=UPI00381FBA6F